MALTIKRRAAKVWKYVARGTMYGKKKVKFTMTTEKRLATSPPRKIQTRIFSD
jgi:hypothetical protein